MEKLDRRYFLKLSLLKLGMFASDQIIGTIPRNNRLSPCSTGRVLKGIASYYSYEGCLGCNPRRIMANGNEYDPEALTLACNAFPLGTWVIVTNLEKNISQLAEVTDHGGFDLPPYYRIADLSVGLNRGIRGRDLTFVTLTEVLKKDFNC